MDGRELTPDEILALLAQWAGECGDDACPTFADYVDEQVQAA